MRRQCSSKLPYQVRLPLHKGATVEGATLTLDNTKPEMLQEVQSADNGILHSHLLPWDDYTISGAKMMIT